ncbi:MAG: chitobiase/beta-hexosaminidase C-terminal domain-containing protein [Candidatus Cloacimonetes bacterium]|nr:chitobiase/beta-hexosaminidase C-terminal domain-containing protein [Candidatus Cloacimonadota bacterium]
MKHSRIIIIAFLVLVTGSWSLFGQGHETFDNFTYTGIAYEDGSFVGNNGVTWNYVHARNQQEFPIDGNGIMLRRSGEGSTIYSGNIPGGIGNFSVQMRKAHTSTGVRQVELFINGVSKGTSIEFGAPSGADDTIHLFEVNDINIEGDFTLEIRHITGGSENRQLVLDNIMWSGYTGNGVPTVSTPTFSPPGGTYYEPVSVTISTLTEGATIHYTTDNSTPTEESPIFDPQNPIQLSENTTLKAKAFKEEWNPSITATANYTFIQTVEVPNIAALRASSQDGTLYRVTGEVILTFKQSFRNQKYIQDDTAAILIDDDSGVITTAYNVGDGIVNMTGTLGSFGNMMQFSPISDPGPANSTGNVIVPEIITAAQFSGNYFQYDAQLLTIRNVTFLGADGSAVFENGVVYQITDGTATIDFRATFYNVDYIGTVIPQEPIDLTGLANARTTPPEGFFISARNIADFAEIIPEDQVLTPILSPPSGQYADPINVSIFCPTENASIYYTIDDTTPTQNSIPYTTPIYLDETTTIKVRAFKEGMAPSNIVTAVYQVGYTTIRQIRENFDYYNGKTVTVQGVVTVGSGTIHATQLRAYIQDESERGIMMFDYTADGNIQRGHRLEVTGTIGMYQGVMQLTDYTYQILATGINIEPYIIELSLAEAQNYQVWEGTMAEVSGRLYENPYYAGGGYNVNIEDQSGRRLTVRVWDSTGINVSRLVRGVPIRARGPVGVYNNQSQLLPAYQEDIIIDIADPVIDDIYWSPENPYVGVPYVDDEITVFAVVFDYDGQIESVELSYRLESVATILDTLDMQFTSNDIYRVDIPPLETYTDWEDNYIISIKATDNDGNISTASKRIPVVKRKPIVYNITFGDPEPGDPLSVTASIVTPSLDPETEIIETRLFYYLNYRAQEYHTDFDSVGVDLYRGFVPGQPQGTIVQVVIFAADSDGLFTMHSEDLDGNEYFYTYSVLSHQAMLKIPPTPFNPWDSETISIGFFSEAGNKAIMRIYNAEGKLMFTPINTVLENVPNSQEGIHYYHWNGRDRSNHILPIGLYICHLEVIDRNTGKKKTANAPIVIGSPLK